MADLSEGRVKVRKFVLDFDEDREAYEEILNNPFCTIIRDTESTDRSGKSMIVCWIRDISDDS